MSGFAVVVSLKRGAYEEAKRLLEDGPPFELGRTGLERHAVYLTRREAVFVFEGPGARGELSRMAESPALWKAAAAWQACMDGRPRIAEDVFVWER